MTTPSAYPLVRQEVLAEALRQTANVAAKMVVGAESLLPVLRAALLAAASRGDLTTGIQLQVSIRSFEQAAVLGRDALAFASREIVKCDPDGPAA